MVVGAVLLPLAVGSAASNAASNAAAPPGSSEPQDEGPQPTLLPLAPDSDAAGDIDAALGELRSAADDEDIAAAADGADRLLAIVTG